MKGSEFLRRLRSFAAERGEELRLDLAHGKGSHGRVYLGARFTTIKDRKKELPPGLLRAMLRDLGIDPNEFWNR